MTRLPTIGSILGLSLLVAFGVMANAPTVKKIQRAANNALTAEPEVFSASVTDADQVAAFGSVLTGANATDGAIQTIDVTNRSAADTVCVGTVALGAACSTAAFTCTGVAGDGRPVLAGTTRRFVYNGLLVPCIIGSIVGGVLHTSERSILQ